MRDDTFVAIYPYIPEHLQRNVLQLMGCAAEKRHVICSYTPATNYSRRATNVAIAH